MDGDYFEHWQENYRASLVQHVEVGVVNIDDRSFFEPAPDIMELRDCNESSSSEKKKVIEPQKIPTILMLGHDEAICSVDSNENNRSNARNSANLKNDGSVVPNKNVCPKNLSVNNTVEPMIEQPKKSRKRASNSSKWKSSTAKRAKNAGQSGVSLRGKQLLPKIMESGCEKSCRFKCHEKINENERKIVFNDFWALADHTRQWDYIARFIRYGTKESEKDDGSILKKRLHTEYLLPVDQDVVKVCRSMFTGTLGITEQWVRTVKRKQMTSSSVSITQDLRGHHGNRPNRISETITQSVKDHIELFPRVESHYCRKSTEAQYLEQGLNLAAMYRLYKEWMQLKDKTEIASEHQYRNIFNYSYNLRFHVPKKDQCDICTEYELSTTIEKAKLEENYKIHQTNKTIVRKLKEVDKTNASKDSSLCIACFDLQKVLSTPKAETSVLYYRRKLAVYNFTVFSIGSKEGYCFVWNETIAKRGANEISSCLWQFIKNVCEKGCKEIIFYSDNCGGQNRNRMVFGTYALAEKVFNVKITHRFLEKGHTQSEGDAMHAAIETASRHKTVYTQQQWCEIMIAAKKKSPVYNVHEMTNENFFDFSNLANQQNWKKDESGQSMQISKVKEISTMLGSDCVQFKYDYLEAPRNINLSKFSNTWKNHTLERAYFEKRKLDQAKKADLAYLCDKNVIPKDAQEFYRSLM